MLQNSIYLVNILHLIHWVILLCWQQPSISCRIVVLERITLLDLAKIDPVYFDPILRELPILDPNVSVLIPSYCIESETMEQPSFMETNTDSTLVWSLLGYECRNAYQMVYRSNSEQNQK